MQTEEERKSKKKEADAARHERNRVPTPEHPKVVKGITVEDRLVRMWDPATRQWALTLGVGGKIIAREFEDKLEYEALLKRVKPGDLIGGVDWSKPRGDGSYEPL